MDVSDRRLQVQLTQEAKIATDFHFIKAIFAVVGFVSAMKRPVQTGRFRFPANRRRAFFRARPGTRFALFPGKPLRAGDRRFYKNSRRLTAITAMPEIRP